MWQTLAFVMQSFDVAQLITILPFRCPVESANRNQLIQVTKSVGSLNSLLGKIKVTKIANRNQIIVPKGRHSFHYLETTLKVLFFF